VRLAPHCFIDTRPSPSPLPSSPCTQISALDPAAEKKLNGALRAAVERSLTAKKIVILDALNLVKGFRYELYCRTREVKTSHCTIYLPVSRATAEARNTALDRYPPSVFDDLWKRLEVPIDANRWDHPVFTLTEDDAAAGTTVGTTAPASGPGPFAESRCVDIDFTAASATDVPESATAASETVFGSSLAALAARIVEVRPASLFVDIAIEHDRVSFPLAPVFLLYSR
jgi:hypothetical protein